MKDTFRAYLPPSETELDELWDDGVIVLDTNALLNLLRFSKTTRDELVEILDVRKARLWMPHQVGVEFHRNRASIPGEQKQLFEDVTTSLDASLAAVSADIERTLARINPAEARIIRRKLKKRFKKLSHDVSSVAAAHHASVLDATEQTKAFDEITGLYKGLVGTPFEPKVLASLYKEAELRYAIRLPPGYMDAKKPAPDKYGDFVIWRQMLGHGEKVKLPLIFVTNDTKEDWWFEPPGGDKSGRPELIEEYIVASGHRAHFYTVLDFLEEAKRRGASVSAQALEESEGAVKASRIEGQRALWIQALNRHNAAILETEEWRSAFERLAASAQAAVPRDEYMAALAKFSTGINSDWDAMLGDVTSSVLRDRMRDFEKIRRAELAEPIEVEDVEADGDEPDDAPNQSEK